MAFFSKSSLFHRILTTSRTTSISSRRTKCSLLKSLIPPSRSLTPENSTSPSHRHTSTSSFSSAAPAYTKFRLPVTKSLIEKLRGMDITRDRIRLDGLFPPPPLLPPTEVAAEEGLTESTYSDEKKVMFVRAAQIEGMRLRLREIVNDWVTYDEFVEICSGNCSGSVDRGKVMARLLEDSGTVIVLGNSVCLHPEQVVRAIQGLVPLPLHPHDPRRTQLAAMETEKLRIDQRAKSLVQRELWGGLAYLVVQTAAFMRLTFWELSWDVMEPICFYVTSFYFMAGYGFFLRTAREPSFEGFFQSRFGAKQRKLMRETGFDLDRYNELRRACGLTTTIGCGGSNSMTTMVKSGGCCCH